MSTDSFCYCTNSPINKIDVFGTEAVSIGLIIASIILIAYALVNGILVGIRAVKELHKTDKYKKTISGGQFLQTIIYFMLGFISGAIVSIVNLLTLTFFKFAIDIILDVAGDIYSAYYAGKKISLKKVVGYIFDSYTDKMGYSYLNKIFEKGLMKAIFDELIGVYVKKYTSKLLGEK